MGKCFSAEHYGVVFCVSTTQSSHRNAENATWYDCNILICFSNWLARIFVDHGQLPRILLSRSEVRLAILLHVADHFRGSC
jgi:hypothetical protein